MIRIGRCECISKINNEETGECVNLIDHFELLELSEIRAQLDIFQMCIFDFFVTTIADFEENSQRQRALMIHLISLNFNSVEIGGLTDFLFKYNDIFAGADIQIDLYYVIATDYFFSIDTLINILIVLKVEEIDLNASDVMNAVEEVTTSTFFKLTAVTFNFDIFVDLFVFVDITLEVVIAQIEIALGFSICLGPGISVGADGNCFCNINLATFNSETFSCNCNADSGLTYDNMDAPTRCICKDPLFDIVNDVCEVKPIEKIVEELDAYQVFIGFFFVESLQLDDNCATTVNYALFKLNFTEVDTGTLGPFLADSADILGENFAKCVDLEAVIANDTFTSIETLVGVIAVCEGSRFPSTIITDQTFIVGLHETITIDFWKTTSETLDLEIFTEFTAEQNVTIEEIASDLETENFLPCFGPGSIIRNGTCECDVEFMSFNKQIGKSSKDSII